MLNKTRTYLRATLTGFWFIWLRLLGLGLVLTLAPVARIRLRFRDEGDRTLAGGLCKVGDVDLMRCETHHCHCAYRGPGDYYVQWYVCGGLLAYLGRFSLW